MRMKKIISKSFQILFKNQILELPLLVYIYILLMFGILMNSKTFTNPYAAIVFSVFMLLLFVAFLSGWFSIIKYSVSNFISISRDDSEYSSKMAIYNKETMRRFFSGVGEYFFPTAIITLLYFLITSLIFIFFMNYFDISAVDLLLNMSDENKLKIYVEANIEPLSKYFLSIFLTIHLFQFLIMFWYPSLFYKIHNPFKAFLEGLKFLFKNFFYSVGVYFFIVFGFILMNILSYLFSSVYILSLLFLVLELYFLTFCFIFIFTAYNEKFIQEKVIEMNNKDVFVKSIKEAEGEDFDKE